VYFYADYKTLRCSRAAFGWSPYSAQANDYLLLSLGARPLMTDVVDFVVLEKKGQRSSPSEVRWVQLTDRPLARKWWDFAGLDAWGGVVGLVRLGHVRSGLVHRPGGDRRLTSSTVLLVSRIM